MANVLDGFTKRTLRAWRRWCLYGNFQEVVYDALREQREADEAEFELERQKILKSIDRIESHIDKVQKITQEKNDYIESLEAENARLRNQNSELHGLIRRALY